MNTKTSSQVNGAKLFQSRFTLDFCLGCGNALQDGVTPMAAKLNCFGSEDNG